ncbi:pyridoxal phosphate-dependent aminotransferase [Ammoniphilus oxalaticus]|uniref:Pyridoxal phosphate-dependent aminotransferase n=1 Tax=Ammoniphilus oxalaticus TaxID=66863 RepID=A0A419SHB2_9BACL|nr:aminotransferase class I/II-fold pyridoxal phosphate-dependent enzyme [Ammoniphilus oxalaticus]RKD23180.1 pyridoxal phosphate-dependent aminotransferase [Ammoniphilus oxalaticus]
MAKNKRRIHLSLPHMSGREQKYIEQAFATNWIAPIGPHVDAFEQEMAACVGTKGAVAVTSGTAAIHLALRLLDVGRGDRVFCSSFTFVASANPIIYQGAEPVFIDSEPETWNMSPQALEKALLDSKRAGKLPKAVIVVHLYGQSAKMDEIMNICDHYGVPIIEDAAESLGSAYKGKASGTLGRFGIYSFNGNKIITTSGGGMLVSNDEVALRKARFFATQAKDPAPYYQHSELGYNYRMSNLLAGVGRAQLEVLEDRVKARREIFRRYEAELGDLPEISFMPELEQTYSNRWLSAFTLEENTGITVQEILYSLEQENIEARFVWKPLHLQPLFKGTDYYAHDKDHHVAESIFKRGICIPSGSNMTVEQQMRVIDVIRAVFGKESSVVL